MCSASLSEIKTCTGPPGALATHSATQLESGGRTLGPPTAANGPREKVTARWWPGLFERYSSADIPRTNNDLEHLFGSHRYHERRASGRKEASPGLVVMGSAPKAVPITSCTSKTIKP